MKRPGIVIAVSVTLAVTLAFLIARARPPTIDLESEKEDPDPASAGPTPPPDESPAAGTAAPPEPAQHAAGSELARDLVDRLALLAVTGGTLDPAALQELDELKVRLAALGEPAVAALVARLDLGADAAGARELLFDVLRGIPGEAAERRIVSEANRVGHPALRTMAIEALRARRTDQSFTVLSEIARRDPELPPRALLASPRSPGDTSTELPDETVFSPRMQAMAALAETRDPRAVHVLVDIVRDGTEEALRMEAARNLQSLRDDPLAADALRSAAATDPSPYVRLAALHSLRGAADPELGPLLAQIAASDPDAGVRSLAQQFLSASR